MYIKYITSILLLMLSADLASQTCCSAGAPVSTFLDLTTDEKTLSLQLNYEYNSINLLVDNDVRLENDPRTRSGQSLILKADYALNSRWAFSAFMPMVHHSRNTLSEEQSSLGPGDLTLLSQYSIVNNTLQNLNFSVGIKLPTGITSQKGRSGILLSPDMQSGSGSIDYLFRTSYNRNDFLLPFLSAQISFLYRMNGTNDNFGSTANFGGRSFAFGDEMTSIISFRYTHTMSSGFLIPDLGIRFRRSNANEEQGIDASNSGGRWINLPLGISYVPDQQKAVRLYVEVPLYQNLEGLQITTDYIIGIQFTYNKSAKNY